MDVPQGGPRGGRWARVQPGGGSRAAGEAQCRADGRMSQAGRSRHLRIATGPTSCRGGMRNCTKNTGGRRPCLAAGPVWIFPLTRNHQRGP